MMPARSDPGDSAPARLRDAWRGFTERALPADWIEAYTPERHVLIAGDAPIFIVNHHSDVGLNAPLFRLNAEGEPNVVAGMPPDYFSPTGQRWVIPALTDPPKE